MWIFLLITYIKHGKIAVKKIEKEKLVTAPCMYVYARMCVLLSMKIMNVKDYRLHGCSWRECNLYCCQSSLSVAVITGAVRNPLVLEGVDDILREFSRHRHSIATLHKLICINKACLVYSNKMQNLISTRKLKLYIIQRVTTFTRKFHEQ